MYQCDWSADVCSSDLVGDRGRAFYDHDVAGRVVVAGGVALAVAGVGGPVARAALGGQRERLHVGRAAGHRRLAWATSAARQGTQTRSGGGSTSTETSWGFWGRPGGGGVGGGGVPAG